MEGYNHMEMSYNQRLEVAMSLPDDFSTEEIKEWFTKYERDYFTELMIQSVIKILHEKKEGYKKILMFIFDYYLNIDIDFNHFSGEKERFITYFAKLTNIEAVEVLIELEADNNFRDSNGLNYLQHLGYGFERRFNDYLDSIDGIEDLSEADHEELTQDWFDTEIKPFFDYMIEEDWIFPIQSTDDEWSYFEEPISKYFEMLS